MTQESIKAKGDELIEKFMSHSYGDHKQIRTFNAVQSARICVEEIIDASIELDKILGRDHNESFLPQLHKWNQVLDYLKQKQ